MFLSIFKMMLNAERCSVLPSFTVHDPDPGCLKTYMYPAQNPKHSARNDLFLIRFSFLINFGSGPEMIVEPKLIEIIYEVRIYGTVSALVLSRIFAGSEFLSFGHSLYHMMT
jgi:hypothetical protein